MIIDSAKYTCAGGHVINEDSYLCRSDKGIFIVADGLGGHSDGEKASMAAVDYFEANCLGGYTEERLNELMEGANTEVLTNGDGGKTTVAAAFAENGRFVYANAGDSRVYYFRDGKIIAQTKDHSVCQASADMGLIRPEDIRRNEDRSRLLKVLGGEERLNIKKHYPPIKIQNGDAFLICTDGFWDYVYETEMEADLLKSGSADVWLKYMLKRHILRAQNKGDNYTAICGIIHLEEGEVYEDIPEPAKPQSKAAPAVSRQDSGKLPILPIAIGAIAVAVIVAVICIFLLLGGNSVGEEQTNTSDTLDTPDISDTSDTDENVTATADESITSTTAESVTATAADTAGEPASESMTDEAAPDEAAEGSAESADGEGEDNENADADGQNSGSADSGESADGDNTDGESADSENSDSENAEVPAET